MKKTVILGAGLTGLSTAYFLKKNYIIYEKDNRPGGLCRTEKIKGFSFDYTGHLLHFRKEEIKKMVFKLLKNQLIEHKRNAFIFLINRFIKYPFQLHMYELLPKMIKECQEGLLKAKKGLFSPPTNFYEWILYNFGEGIGKYFMIPYNKKVWTVHPKELIFEWARRFIPQIKLKNMIAATSQEVFCGKIGYNSCFFYPEKGGIESLPQAFLPYITNLNLNKTAVKIKNQKVFFTNGEEIKYNYLISTIPLPELIKLIDNVPLVIKTSAKTLKYTSVYNINLGVKGITTDKHWIYFPEKEFIFYRIGFNSNFSPYVSPKNLTGIYIEVAYPAEKKIDKSHIYQQVINDLKKCGILHSKTEIITEKTFDIKYATVIYDHKYKASTKIIHRFLKKNNIFSIGRFGGWQYLTMEDCILEAKKIAKLLKNK